MITLDIDLSYLAKHFEISTQRLNQYTGKSIEEVMETEASQGNQAASGYKSVFNNPQELIELLKLTDPLNRFLIIKNLNEDDLKKVLEYLDSSDLVWGLQYFNIDKLVELLEELPQDELLELVLDKFSVENVIALMKNDELDKFLTNEDVEKDHIMEFFKSLPEDQFRKLMFQVLGPEALFSEREDMLKTVNELGDNDFKKFMRGFKTESKKLIAFGLITNEPKYIKKLENKALARPFQFLEKSEIINSMSKLKPEFLIPMIEELPTDLIQVVATQIDPSVFIEFLSKNFGDVLSQIAL